MDIDINWGLLAPVIALQLILMITALVSLLKAQTVRGTKWIWALVIIFGNMSRKHRLFYSRKEGDLDVISSS